MIYLDRLPRIKMLYGGNLGLVAVLSILTALTAVSTKAQNSGTQAGGIAMLFVYSIIYSATYGYAFPLPPPPFPALY